MEERISAAVAGGDLRQVYAANALAQRGFAVTAFGFSGEEPFSQQVTVAEELSLLERAQLLILPLMGKKLPLEDCFPHLSPDCQVFGGNCTEEEKATAEYYGFSIHDYFKVEELTVANAVLTAEAAIELAMAESPALSGAARLSSAAAGALREPCFRG